jgi:hypothetical protein
MGGHCRRGKGRDPHLPLRTRAGKPREREPASKSNLTKQCDSLMDAESTLDK